MKKALVMLYPMFTEYELSVAMSVLAQGGKEVVTAAYDDTPLQGEAGLTCLPDAAWDEIDVREFDCAVLPGMAQPLSAGEEKACLTLLKKLAAQPDMLFASVSYSPYLLAEAGILRGKRFTIGMYEEEMAERGIFEKENFRKQALVQHGNVITAVGSGFAAFGKALGNALRLEFDEEWYQP